MIKIGIKDFLAHYFLVVVLIILVNICTNNTLLACSLSVIIMLIPLAYYYFLYDYAYNDDSSNSSTAEAEVESDDNGIKYPITIYGAKYINGCCKVYKIESANIMKLNYIDKNGYLISDTWYAGGTDFNQFNLAIVKLVKNEDTIFYIINSAGKPIIDKAFYNIEEYSSDGLCKVYWKDGTINFVDTDGKLLFNEWKNESNVKITVKQ